MKRQVCPWNRTICGFIRRPGRRIEPQNCSREEQGKFGDFIRRFRNRRSNRRINPREKNQSGVNCGFIRRSPTADYNRRTIPETSGLILRFHSAATDRRLNRRFTNLGETKGEAKGFSNGDLRAKNKHTRCMRGRFRTTTGNELQDTKAHNKIQHQGASVKCDMWRECTPNARMLSECVQLSLQEK